jgi:uncharacterized protein (DUF1778 family)
MPSEALKTERIEARIRPADKAFLEEAARHLGISLADFVTSSAQARAEEVIRRRDEVMLSRQEQEAFVRALLNPAPPNDKLRAAVAEYGASVEP